LPFLKIRERRYKWAKEKMGKCENMEMGKCENGLWEEIKDYRT
jgi:hypothetical protein